MADRTPVRIARGIGQPQLIGLVLPPGRIVFGQPQRETSGGRSIVDLHLQLAPAVAIQIDSGRSDQAVGRGMDCNLSALDGPNVTLSEHNPVGNARVVGIVVLDIFDQYRRGHADLHGKSPRDAIAGAEVVLQILLQSEFTRRQFALIPRVVFRSLHGDGLIDALPVGRGVIEQNILVVIQTLDPGRHFELFATKLDRVARGEVLDRHPGRCGPIGPRPDHSGRRDQRILRREDQI